MLHSDEVRVAQVRRSRITFFQCQTDDDDLGFMYDDALADHLWAGHESLVFYSLENKMAQASSVRTLVASARTYPFHHARFQHRLKRDERRASHRLEHGERRADW